jgi:ubiquinone/menaquinone biosynthesis C-methylase UbiE
MMESLSFDSMAAQYDETRIFDERCFNYALDFFYRRFPPFRYGNMFYPGIGTGRIAVPLAEKGYRITGIDISDKMLALLEEKLRQPEKALPVVFQKADVLNLPFSKKAFDIAVAGYFFYFIPQWQKAVRETLRVVRDSGALVIVHTGMGTEVPVINERYREICSARGYDIPAVGVKSNREVVAYCEGLGYRSDWVRDRWQWTTRIKLEKALEYVKSRAYSFTASTPPEVHTAAIEGLTFEMQSRFGSLAAEVQVPNQVYFAIIYKTA